VRIALIQTSASEDIKLNLENAIGLAKRAAKDGGEIICLPELYRTRYFPQSECIDASAFSETIPGESTRRFSEVAKKHNCVIIVPLFEREGSRFYNAAAVIDCDGSLLGTYRKVHIPHDPLFYEKNYFMEDVGGFKAFDTSAGRIAVLICYDQWFPEAARAAALERAEIIFYPTAIGWISGMELPDEGDWHQAWELVQRGHAIANGIPVAAVNRIGAEGMLRFWGGSFVCDAFGAVQARGGDSEEIITADVDLEKGRSVGDSSETGDLEPIRRWLT
jgi:agmatine deiminase